MQRAINYVSLYPSLYLFAKEYTETNKGSHYYEVWDLDHFFKKYQNDNPYDRIYGDALWVLGVTV